MTVDALKGSATTTLRNKRATELPAFGTAKECTKSDLERVLKLMLEKGYVDEYYEKLGDWGGVTGYLRTGPRADALTRGEPLHMLVAKAGAKGGAKGGGRDTGALPVRGGLPVAQDDPLAPVRAELTKALGMLREVLFRDHKPKLRNKTHVWSDKATAEMAEKLPVSHTQLA
jgi:superfamily II DNA helicase RecQ